MLRERNSNVCRQEYPILASQSITRNSNGEREGFLLAQSLLKNKLTCNTYTIEISKIAAKKFPFKILLNKPGELCRSRKYPCLPHRRDLFQDPHTSGNSN